MLEYHQQFKQDNKLLIEKSSKQTNEYVNSLKIYKNNIIDKTNIENIIEF